MKTFKQIAVALFLIFISFNNVIGADLNSSNASLLKGYNWYKIGSISLFQKKGVMSKQVKTREFDAIILGLENTKNGGFDLGIYYVDNGKKETYIEVDKKGKEQMLNNSPIPELYKDAKLYGFSVYIYKSEIYLGVKIPN
jgi:hypothetical protein